MSNENGRVALRVHPRRLFVSETFYLAARAFTHALIPAVRRYEEAMQILHQRAIGGVSSAENGDVPKTAAEAIADDVDYNAYHDCFGGAAGSRARRRRVQVQFAHRALAHTDS